MPHVITPASTWHATIDALADGDPVAQASNDPTFQQLADNTKYLHTTVGVDGNGNLTKTATASNTAPINYTGIGSGAGGVFTGGATGNGVNGVGGSTSGHGVNGTATAGNSRGGNFTGQGSGDGARGTGGGSSGIGVRGIGGASNGIGVQGEGTGTGVGGRFDGQGTGTAATDDAVEVLQNIKFSGSNPAATTGFSNRLTPKNVLKAWGKIDCQSGTITIRDGFNIASASFSGDDLVVNFATALNLHYAPVFNIVGVGGGATPKVNQVNMGTTSFQVGAYDSSGASWNLSSASSTTVVFHIYGAQ